MTPDEKAPKSPAPRPLPGPCVDRPLREAEPSADDAGEPERCYRDGSAMNECWHADR